MSKEYDEYIKNHINAVGTAAKWMLSHLALADETLTDEDKRDIISNVTVHDFSKHDEPEYSAYDDYFYGDRDEDAFNYAWLHHIHSNPHHWQHWILVMDDKKMGERGKVVALEMPKVYVWEMVADWWSFSWRSGKLTEIFEWYDSLKDGIVMHENTRKLVEAILGEIREAVES